VQVYDENHGGVVRISASTVQLIYMIVHLSCVHHASKHAQWYITNHWSCPIHCYFVKMCVMPLWERLLMIAIVP